MTDRCLDKLRRRTKKNYKRFVTKNFIKYMYKALSLIPFSVQNSCYISAPQEHRFILWLVTKKLERQGFQCKVKKGITILELKKNDELIIKWDKSKSPLKEDL
jgi:hypothetical protein